MENQERLVYEGYVVIGNEPRHDETVDIVMLAPKNYPVIYPYGPGSSDIPVGEDKSEWIILAEKLQSEIADKTITLRFWVTEEKTPLSQVQTEFLHQVMGFSQAEYYHQYSEITGYLYTTQELIVGGHDIMQMIECHVGKYLILEIIVH